MIKDVRGYSDPALARKLLSLIKENAGQKTRIMEVCGTHTAAFSRTGLRTLLPSSLSVIPGPGCPVCVTPAHVIDQAIGLAREEGVTLLTFGDMAAVPGSRESLLAARGRGAAVEVVASPFAAVRKAEEHSSRQYVFLACGFETTAPAVAMAVLEAKDRGLNNFSVLSALRRIAPAISAVLREGGIDGLICPGHVAAVTGAREFAFVSEKYRVPAVVAGFEAVDLLHAVWKLQEMIRHNSPQTVNAYRRFVRERGNRRLQRIVHSVFSVADACWRGIGELEGSGFKLLPAYARFDAEKKFALQSEPAAETSFQCAAVLRGAITPPECPSFANACTPGRPRGPCMVSAEGSCAVYYRYERVQTIVRGNYAGARRRW